ncbi:hypothetical protein EMIT036CA2_100015 [Chryseobacterium sp. IT-36CA2]
MFKAFITKGLANYFILSSTAEQRKLNVYNELVYNFLYQIIN